jgi:hypothetical protein
MRRNHRKHLTISIRRKSRRIDNPIRQSTAGKYEKTKSRTGSNYATHYTMLFDICQMLNQINHGLHRFH